MEFGSGRCKTLVATVDIWDRLLQLFDMGDAQEVCIAMGICKPHTDLSVNEFGNVSRTQFRAQACRSIHTQDT